MADFQNAGYRLLSFKYVPPITPAAATNQLPVAAKEAQQPAINKSTKEASDGNSTVDEDLPSLSSLLTSLREIEALEKAVVSQDAAVDETSEDVPSSQAGPLPTEIESEPEPEFPHFQDLPTEIRLKIWALTFLPRVLEIRPTRPNYSAARTDGAREPEWLSGNTNPATLSVNAEARELALAHFRIPFPLAFLTTTSPDPLPSTSSNSNTTAPIPNINPFNLPSSPTTPRLSYHNTLIDHNSPSSTSPSQHKARLLRRTLYISPEHDTVCLLGQDSDLARLAQCIASFRIADPLGTGLEKLGLSVRGWAYGGSRVALRMLGRAPDGVLAGVRELVFFMYGEHRPPTEWRVRGEKGGSGQGEKKGNRCALVRCDEESSPAWYAYKVWSGGMGRQFRDGDGAWMRFGSEQREIRVMDLVFEEGW